MVETIKSIVKLDSNQNKRVVLNDTIICKFIVPDDLSVDSTYYFFSECAREANSRSFYQYADVYIYDTSHRFKSGPAKLYHWIHPELDTPTCRDTLTLMTEDKRMLTVINAKIEDDIFPLSTFVKLLDTDKRISGVEDPVYNLGLTTVDVFDIYGRNRYRPTLTEHWIADIEYNIDGTLYYEVLDMTDYEDGEVIPITSASRKTIISYVKLTKENAIDLADLINKSIKRVKERFSERNENNDKDC